MDYKKKVLEQLKLLADDKRAKKETFRVRAYQNAIQAIKEYEGEINTPEDLDKISGLAKGSIRKKIIELIKTGEISQVKDITTNIKIIQDLSNIYGVGPSKANELISKYGGRGRSRTHQALCQRLTGVEDQAPHRGRRSSKR